MSSVRSTFPFECRLRRKYTPAFHTSVLLNGPPASRRGRLADARHNHSLGAFDGNLTGVARSADVLQILRWLWELVRKVARPAARGISVLLHTFDEALIRPRRGISSAPRIRDVLLDSPPQWSGPAE